MMVAEFLVDSVASMVDSVALIAAETSELCCMVVPSAVALKWC